MLRFNGSTTETIWMNFGTETNWILERHSRLLFVAITNKDVDVARRGQKLVMNKLIKQFHY